MESCTAIWKKVELGYSLHQKLMILFASGKGTGGQWYSGQQGRDSHVEACGGVSWYHLCVGQCPRFQNCKSGCPLTDRY